MIPFTDEMLDVFNGVTKAELGYLIYLDFDPAKGSGGGPMLLSTFPYPELIWDPGSSYVGTSWAGRARIAGLGQMRWSADTVNTPLTLTLGMADPDRFNDALNASRRQFATFWLTAYAIEGTVGIVPDPRAVMKRRMFPANASSKNMIVTLGLEAVFNATRKRAIKRRSNADQILIDPLDACLADASQGTLGTDSQVWADRSGHRTE
jgi:hypothetical protein